MKTLFIISLMLSATAYQQACELVAQKAGHSYKVKLNRFASITAPEDLPQSITAELLTRNGMWFIYKSTEDMFTKEQCSPQQRDKINIVPVLFNQSSGHNAVVNGVFLIKTYQEKDINLITNRHNFKKVTQLPNRFSAIFDVKPQDSYDQLIEALDNDKDIEKLVPLLSEPTYSTR